MNTKRIISLSIAVIISTITFAFERQGPSKEDIEKFRAKKISFITEKLQLTPEEAQNFWPIYNQSEKESWEAQKQRREIENRLQTEEGNISDKEIIELTEKMVESHKAEALVREKYNKKFLEVLPPQKVLKLYQAEHQFRMQMLHEFRNRRPDKD